MASFFSRKRHHGLRCSHILSCCDYWGIRVGWPDWLPYALFHDPRQEDPVVTIAAGRRSGPNMPAVTIGTARSTALAASLLLGLCVSCTVAVNDESQALVAELDAKIPEAVARGRSPSVQVAVIHRSRLVWSRAYGEGTSVDHVYMNGSVQKVFDAAAVLRLADKGPIDLDGDVSAYLPFLVRHPGFPNRPITVRMLLEHRAGLVAFPRQFDWDTERIQMSLEEYIETSLRSAGSNAEDEMWSHEPGTRYRYSIAAYPLLRYVIERVSKQNFPEFMRENLFGPLQMTSSGFSAKEFADRHAVPYTRVGGENVALPVWSGNGFVMHTTAADQTKLMIALMSGGRIGEFELLRPETVVQMSDATTRFRVLFKRSDDLQPSGHELGLFTFRGGWLGYGGSTPGFQCLWRFHPGRKVGYVILSNVNAINSADEDIESVRHDLYSVQNALVSILDPTLALRNRASELAIAGAVAFGWCATVVCCWRRARARRGLKNLA